MQFHIWAHMTIVRQALLDKRSNCNTMIKRAITHMKRYRERERERDML